MQFHLNSTIFSSNISAYLKYTIEKLVQIWSGLKEIPKNTCFRGKLRNLQNYDFPPKKERKLNFQGIFLPVTV